MTEEQEQSRAIEALTQSEEYISKTASDKMVQSIVSDFQLILNTALYKVVLSHFEDPESFLNEIKENWKKRAQFVLKQDLKRFQDTIIKATAEDNNLKDNFQNVLNNYTLTIESAYNKSETIVNDLIDSLIDRKKETKNDNTATEK